MNAETVMGAIQMGRPGPVEVPKAVRVSFRSSFNQRCYSISLALPLGKCSKVGCPVLYVLDGNWYFGSAVEAVRANAPGVAVVGIGYPEEEPYVQSVVSQHEPLPAWARDEPVSRVAVAYQRMYDLSLEASEEVLTSDFYSAWRISPRDVGGLNAFLRVIESEIKPWVASMVAVDASNQAIFGHSLAGLAVLHALFVAPTAFQTFIAASPTIWWSDRAVLAGEAGFADAVRTGVAAPRVLVTMGGEEDAMDMRVARKAALEPAEFANRIRAARMIESARELTERLTALPGHGKFKVDEFTVFPKQGHGVSPWPTLGRAVSFAFLEDG